MFVSNKLTLCFDFFLFCFFVQTVFSQKNWTITRTLNIESGVNGFSKEGLLISGFSVVHMRTGKILRQLTDGRNNYYVYRSLVTENDEIIYTANNFISIYDIKTGRLVREVRDSSRNEIKGLKISKDGQLVTLGGSIDSNIKNNVIKIWDVQTLQVLIEFPTNDNVLSWVFSKEGQLITGTSEDAAIKIWDLQTGKLLKTLLEGGNWWSVVDLAISEQGELISSEDNRANPGNNLKVWDIETGKIKRILPYPNFTVRSLLISREGLLFGGLTDNTVKIWNVATGEELQTLYPCKNTRLDLYYLSMSKEGILICACKNGLDFWERQ